MDLASRRLHVRQLVRCNAVTLVWVHADRKSNMQYMRALFVSEEPEEDVPEKMSGLLSDFKIQSERRKKGPRILGLTGSDVTKVSPGAPYICPPSHCTAVGSSIRGACTPDSVPLVGSIYNGTFLAYWNSSGSGAC